MIFHLCLIVSTMTTGMGKLLFNILMKLIQFMIPYNPELQEPAAVSAPSLPGAPEPLVVLHPKTPTSGRIHSGCGVTHSLIFPFPGDTEVVLPGV